ncbi:lectin-like [Apostichopus japonicus]|uniref:lectin-like n=1 Tax=Stichopus japonicus TaxID=307972 RepID=UPI003AB917EF
MKSIILMALVILTITGQVVNGSVEPKDPRFGLTGCSTTDGWKEYDGHCYKLVVNKLDEGMSYEDMKTACAESGPSLAFLADVHSMEENDFIAEVVALRQRAWLGAQKIPILGFVWEQGPRPFFTFDNWKPGEPNDSGNEEDCIEINRGPPGMWNDLPCRRKRAGVCKYSIADYASQSALLSKP